MESLKDIIDRQHLDRPPHDDPLTDRLLAELVRLAEEVCVLRDRLDTCERLAAAGQSAGCAAIDEFEPTNAMLEERLAKHREFFESVFARLQP